MICKADTVGVPSRSNRAQMSMLPRLQPRTPLRPRGRGRHRAAWPHRGRWHAGTLLEESSLAARSDHTQGRPEGCSSRHLRRAHLPGTGHAGRHDCRRLHGHGTDTPRHMVSLEAPRRAAYYDKIRAYANAAMKTTLPRRSHQIKGFSSYGFPESHAASFGAADLASCLLKMPRARRLLCALLNSQPLGFTIHPASWRDVRRHHIEVRPIDESQRPRQHAGAARGRGAAPSGAGQRPAGDRGTCSLRCAPACASSAAWAPRSPSASNTRATKRPFTHPPDQPRAPASASRRCRSSPPPTRAHQPAGHRRQQVWQASALHTMPALLQAACCLKTISLSCPRRRGRGEAVGLRCHRPHPCAATLACCAQRPRPRRPALRPPARRLKSGRRAKACGIVTGRQNRRPPKAPSSPRRRNRQRPGHRLAQGSARSTAAPSSAPACSLSKAFGNAATAMRHSAGTRFRNLNPC